MEIYKTGWIKENLGITRKTIIEMEKNKLLSKHTPGDYRYFTYDEVKIIWVIKVMHDIGLTYPEIKKYIDYLVNNEDKIINDDYFPKLMEKCINNLRQEIAEKQKSLEYASSIMLTGKIPVFPKKFGKVTVKEFNTLAKEEYSEEGKIGANVLELQELLKNITEDEEISNESLANLVNLFKSIFDSMELSKNGVFISLLFRISRYKELGCDNEKVQTLIEMMHDYKNDDEGFVYTREFSSAMFISGLTSGLSGMEIRKQLGDENYLFTLDALLFYGNFKSISEADELLEKVREGKISKYADGHFNV